MTSPESATEALSWSTYAWRLAITLLFVLLNGFFVAAEFALVKVRVAQLESRARAGSRGAAIAQRIHAHLDHYLSACQLGITISSLILGWLAEPAIAELLLAGAVSLGFEAAPTDPLLHGIALAIALTIVTVFHMTIGEQAPKIYAIRRAEITSIASAAPLFAFSLVFRPFIWVINGISNWLLRLAGLQESEFGEHSHTVEEIQAILAGAAEAGQITPRAREFAQNILHIVGMEVRHILLPRVDVVYLSLQNSNEENLRIIRQSAHTRFPLCEVGLDTVIGQVHAKNVMATLVDKGEVDLRALARKPVFVPDTMPVSRLIRTLQHERSHSAVVLDERGTAVGLAFLEDALEEIVGPIHDEFDEVDSDVVPVEPGVVEMPGSLPLPEAIDLLSCPELGDEVDTIGGWVTAQLGRLPLEGDEVAVGEMRFVVQGVEQRRITRVRMHSASESSEEAPPEEPAAP